MRVSHILEVCLYATDLEAAERFYHDILGFPVRSCVAGRHVFFDAGAFVFLMFNPEATRVVSGEVPTHGAVGEGHVAFAIEEASFETWRAHLEAHDVEIEMELIWPSQGKSLYFRDPAGNSVELATPRVWSIDEANVFSK